MSPKLRGTPIVSTTVGLSGFGEFLRSRREALLPEATELKRRPRRRTPGLRREEIAERAGISVDWYVRLEQGRTVAPSATTLRSLVKALGLNKVEAAHLRALAGNPPRPLFIRETVPEDLRRMLKHWHQPAYITGLRWDLLAWNQATEELLGDLTRVQEPERNLLLFMLARPEMKTLFADTWEVEARRMLALFRATYDLWAGDPAFVELRERLRAGCPQFDCWWDTHEVAVSAAVHKVLHHPVDGPVRFSTASFQANDNPSLRLALFTPTWMDSHLP